jgi:hypothetical protein
MFGGGSSKATILRAGPDALKRTIVRHAWSGQSLLVEAREAEPTPGRSSTARRSGSRRAGDPTCG